MAYHIVLNHAFDLEGIARAAAADQRPRHCMADVAELLDATIHVPGGDAITSFDRLRSKLIGRPQDWAMARRLAPKLGREDIVYCTGEAMAFPLAALCDPKNLPTIAVYVHNPMRPKAKLTMQLFGLARRIDLYITESVMKAEFLRSFLQVPPSHVQLFQDQATDTRFFKPATTPTKRQRPLIASGGMERRDYKTLAAATQDLDVDVQVSAVSPDSISSSCVMPEKVPSNMVCRPHEWDELRQLYQDADIMVVPLVPNYQQAGITTLFEAMACRKPTIMTRVQGMSEQLIDEGYVIGVDANNPAQLKAAIADLLANPEKADALAQRGYELITKRHNQDMYSRTFATLLSSRYGASAAPLKNNVTLPPEAKVLSYTA